MQHQLLINQWNYKTFSILFFPCCCYALLLTPPKLIALHISRKTIIAFTLPFIVNEFLAKQIKLFIVDEHSFRDFISLNRCTFAMDILSFCFFLQMMAFPTRNKRIDSCIKYKTRNETVCRDIYMLNTTAKRCKTVTAISELSTIDISILPTNCFQRSF